jgi:hypothetical protein
MRPLQRDGQLHLATNQWEIHWKSWKKLENDWETTGSNNYNFAARYRLTGLGLG